ncbi:MULTISPECIES: Coenzyme F420 hydrogenase/dehydrogenase, beta subunit C-terminal domain [unclassified Lacrimispora]|uniref:Coenzyme F420 hydrogenase/dehydrogenase, beta subunit C-terminal domain n=1 Tax=unclassified Lacrimispora TaxID=2719232 RepID=UPI00376FC5FA
MNVYTKIYACYNKNELIRKDSSSGGIFYSICKKIIEMGGVVFGASFDENFEVVHSCCESVEMIQNYLGSKYVQSMVGYSFIKVKEYLDFGRHVLFSGTPCQVAGLKAYLGCEYNNLITIDFICHGVPSKKVWRKYKDKLSDGNKIESINFRSKKKGWRNFSLHMVFHSGGEYLQGKNKDPYLLGFLHNLYLRPSCYECQFKAVYHAADITLGDFWKAENLLKQDDDKGISVAMLQSEKGETLFDEILRELVIVGEPDIEFIKETNSALISSAALTNKRKLFYERYENDFSKIVIGMTENSVYMKAIRKLKRIFNL